MKKLIKTFESFNLHMGDDEFERGGSVDHEGHHESENYMFFGNLETIHRLIGEMLQMDPKKVDEILKNGHNWAADHIATSKDDIEEVAGFLINEMSEPSHDERAYAEEIDEDAYSMSEGYMCNECGTMYESYEIDEDQMCNECGAPLTVVEASRSYANIHPEKVEVASEEESRKIAYDRGYEAGMSDMEENPENPYFEGSNLYRSFAKGVQDARLDREDIN